MASLENSLKYESEVEPGKVRLISSGEFVRAYNHSAWLFYCCISKYKVIRKYSKAQQKDVYFLGFRGRTACWAFSRTTTAGTFARCWSIKVGCASSGASRTTVSGSILTH